MKILLLTGIPGVGKTHIGDYLRDKYGFIHLDIEDHACWPHYIPQINNSASSAGNTMESVKQQGKDTVITWGFWPTANDNHIYEFINNGAQMFWLDGNRKVAKKFWRKRHPYEDEVQFDNQIKRIDETNVDRFAHTKLNPIGLDETHLSEEEIAEKLLSLTVDQ